MRLTSSVTLTIASNKYPNKCFTGTNRADNSTASAQNRHGSCHASVVAATGSAWNEQLDSRCIDGFAADSAWNKGTALCGVRKRVLASCGSAVVPAEAVKGHSLCSRHCQCGFKTETVAGRSAEISHGTKLFRFRFVRFTRQRYLKIPRRNL